ncbi:hypothetical protein [Senegalia massiliensis]|uniref:Uncharacterized protein n=1 Tax=Senegalia massiliensis TaxID=1720316 RepID=A0A845QVU7_9CLOT|nr:hypothetical protein [Senegalia massiliensis]NBI06210.1 hypothetical protein [Senegalia massiliensis]
MTQSSGKIIIIMMAILLILNGYILLNFFSSDTIQDISRLKEQIYFLEDEIYNLKQDLKTEEEKSSLISSHNYDIENIGNEYKNANVAVQVEFKKLKNKSTPYIIYSIAEKEGTAKVKLDKVSELKYTTELNLSYNDNYNVKLFMENDEVMIGEELSPIKLAEELARRFTIHMYPTEFEKGKELKYEIQIFNSPIEDKKDLEINSIKADIYYMDEKLDTIDITKNAEKKKLKDITKEYFYEGNLGIEGIDDEIIQEKLLFKFIIKDKYGKVYNLDKKFKEFISN